jgi:hypothetical protein
MALRSVEKVPAAPVVASLNSDDEHRENSEQRDGEKSDTCDNQHGGHSASPPSFENLSVATKLGGDKAETNETLRYDRAI